jgi:NadR type nicotinamide-nucleotide adenylyltransferase
MTREPSVKRVCVVGAESTGTTTLAQRLAAYYRTVWVPEYGREYSERLAAEGIDVWHYGWHTEEFVHIARVQQQREDAMARKSNRVLICDTDALATAIWHERYLGTGSAEVEALAYARHYDLYLVTGCEIPFVQDGIRDGENLRQWMTTRFEEVLTLHKRPWLKLSGTLEQRMLAATTAVDQLLTPPAATPL